MRSSKYAEVLIVQTLVEKFMHLLQTILIQDIDILVHLTALAAPEKHLDLLKGLRKGNEVFFQFFSKST